jgi:hypothetical protein
MALLPFEGKGKSNQSVQATNEKVPYFEAVEDARNPNGFVCKPATHNHHGIPDAMRAYFPNSSECEPVRTAERIRSRPLTEKEKSRMMTTLLSARERFSNQRANITQKKDKTMKQVLLFAASAVLLATLSGCGSLRTPGSGANAEKVYYSTFFGISIESAVYGDGIIVNNK